jgi:hypothetical protein
MYTLSETLYDSSNSFSAGGGHRVDDYGDCLGAAHDTGSWVKISRNINLAGATANAGTAVSSTLDLHGGSLRCL